MTTWTVPCPAPATASSTETITVRMGDIAVAMGDTRLRTVGLGSCLAIIIFAPGQHLAALAHCMLPTCDDPAARQSKYTDTAVPELVASLEAHDGAAPFFAALIGGASMFPGISAEFMPDIAAQNLQGARAALARMSIPVRVEDVGGQTGRSVVVEPVSQRIMVHTIRGGERWL